MMKMGRMTKRNRAKHRRRAYAAGMRQTASAKLVVSPMNPPDREPGDFDGKRAA